MPTARKIEKRHGRKGCAAGERPAEQGQLIYSHRLKFFVAGIANEGSRRPILWLFFKVCKIRNSFYQKSTGRTAEKREEEKERTGRTDEKQTASAQQKYGKIFVELHKDSVKNFLYGWLNVQKTPAIGKNEIFCDYNTILVAIFTIDCYNELSV